MRGLGTAMLACVAVRVASPRARLARGVLPASLTDSHSRLCVAALTRETCISAAKVTFGAVTAQGRGVAVSSLACRVARHVRHYPTPRADSDSLAATLQSKREGGAGVERGQV